MMTNKDSSAAGLKLITPFIRTHPAKSKIQATLLGLNNTFPFVEKIIKEYTGQRPIHIQEACFEHTKKCFKDRVIPFLDMFKIHVMHCEVTWFKEATEFNKIFDELDNAYAKCFADKQSLYAMNKRNIAKNKCLQIQKKNLLIHDESLIADCIANDVCSIVLAFEREVFPRSNCRSTESSFETKALETEIAQLKEGLTSLKIQNDGYKKIATQKAEIATLKAEAIGKKNSRPAGTPTKPKVLASGMYTKSLKYIPPQKEQIGFNRPCKACVNTSTNAWNATKNTIARIVPIWKPTGRRFNLHDIFGSRTSTEPIIKPSELTPCVSPSTNATLSLEPILEPVELSPSVSSCASSTITMVSRRRKHNTSFKILEALEDDPTSPKVDQSYVDPEGDILILEAFFNDDPSLPPPNQGNYLPQVQKELKIYEAITDKSSIDEPPEVELKDLPPHLEYTFLEGDDKLPVIIAKDLSVEEKTTLITVLKSHKQAIAWKLFDIKGIDPEFCTHKILMEDDFEPVVQHQRRVNPKIYDFIKMMFINSSMLD
nr:reverse transcriptase domain-containing protein [Tanacetum cinerariifolium]